MIQCLLMAYGKYSKLELMNCSNHSVYYGTQGLVLDRVRNLDFKWLKWICNEHIIPFVITGEKVL